MVTDTDHTAWIIIATGLGLSCVLLFGGIGIFVRYTISPRFRLDNASLAASTISLSNSVVPTGLLGALIHRPALLCASHELKIVAVIQPSTVVDACSDGLGKSIELVPLGIQAKVQRVRKTALALCAINHLSIDVLCQHSDLRCSSQLFQDLGRLLPSAFNPSQISQVSLPTRQQYS